MSDRDDPWAYVQDWDVEMFGEDIRDADARRRWERAFTIAGGLPYMWQTIARPVTDVIYGLMEVQRGDRVFVIGEGVEPAGWGDGLRGMVGPSGAVEIVEIIRDGRNAVMQKKRGRNGRLGCWQWTYTHGIADASFDCVGILQSTQHCDDWGETMPELLRIMKPGRRVVFAEAVLGGPSFMARINADVHIRQWYEKLFDRRMDYSEVSQYSGDDLMRLCGGLLASPRALEWHGIEMFWGRKPDRESLA